MNLTQIISFSVISYDMTEE